MQDPIPYSFTRYLAAKRSVDDRALNHNVATVFRNELARCGTTACLELGGGIGTMVERLWRTGALSSGAYHLVDASPENIRAAALRLVQLSSGATHAPGAPEHIHLPAIHQGSVEVCLHCADVYDFLDVQANDRSFDVVIAHAFLDLLDVRTALPRIVRVSRPGALVYFTINFDGATILEPELDPAFDGAIERAYHSTMDSRVVNGQPSGDSRTGRHLYHWLTNSGIDVMEAGSSDWVVIPHGGHYADDEAYFLHFIIHTMEMALTGTPGLDPHRLAAWFATRRAQIDHGELVYIAHQIDYVGRVAV